jgi:hypothetical protein
VGVFENRMLRRIFGPQRDVEGNYIMKNFITCTVP